VIGELLRLRYSNLVFGERKLGCGLQVSEKVVCYANGWILFDDGDMCESNGGG